MSKYLLQVNIFNADNPEDGFEAVKNFEGSRSFTIEAENIGEITDKLLNTFDSKKQE